MNLKDPMIIYNGAVKAMYFKFKMCRKRVKASTSSKSAYA